MEPSRVVIMLAAVVAFAVLVVAIAGIPSGGAEEHDARPAPRQCLELWNRDPDAVAQGLHNLTAHGYTEVEVTRLSSAPGSIRGSARRRCAVIFASAGLGPELGNAARIHARSAWQALSGLISADGLTELQARAVKRANARINPTGGLDPL